MKLKLYYTLDGNSIYSRIFDTEEDMWASEPGSRIKVGIRRWLDMDRDKIMEVHHFLSLYVQISYLE